MSNTAEGNVEFIPDSFVHDMRVVAVRSPFTPIAGAALGMGAGVLVENGLTGNSARNSAQGHIAALNRGHHTLEVYAQRAQTEGNIGAQTFLRHQATADTRQIVSIRASEPKPAGTAEDAAFMGGGALLGAIALTALLAVVARDKTRHSRQAKS